MALTAEQTALVGSIAKEYAIPRNFALGVVDKESSGHALWDIGGRQLPSIRIEGHIFHRLLAGNERAAATKAGFASPKAGAVKNPRSMKARYSMLQQMAKINVSAAYEATSVGIGQVMGFNHDVIGYKDVTGMFADAFRGFKQQVQQFLKFIAADKVMLRAAQTYQYKVFGKRYNGKAAPASYWTELQMYVESYKEGEQPSHGYRERIQKLGYETIELFQTSHGLEADGKVGPITLEALKEAEANAAKEANRPAKNVAVGTVVAATVSVGGVTADNPNAIPDTINAVKDAVTSVKPVTDLVLPHITGGLSLVPKLLVFGGSVTLAVLGCIVLWNVYTYYKTNKRTS